MNGRRAPEHAISHARSKGRALPLLRDRVIGPLGVAQFVSAFGSAMVGLAWRLWRAPSDQTASRLFAFSILYLFILFAALLIEPALGALFGRGAA